MKYNQPPGMSADAPYIDGNRSAGTKGSVVPAAAIELPQRELVNLIAYSGQTPDNADLDQVRKAIGILIAAATGGGDTADYLTMVQARARLPLFPEILTADGRINVLSPGAGSVMVPAGVSFQHRGIYPVGTSDYDEAARTFATAANKTYHVRWTPADGFALKDVSDGGYNPTAAAETDAMFDSAYDDMLVARVVTSSGNVATITNLVNRNRLDFGESYEAALIFQAGWATLAGSKATLSWARSPKIAFASLSGVRSIQTPPDGTKIVTAAVGIVQSLMLRQSSDVTRYGFADLEYNYDDTTSTHGYATYSLTAIA
jgi:hypothetical protein